MESRGEKRKDSFLRSFGINFSVFFFLGFIFFFPLPTEDFFKYQQKFEFILHPIIHWVGIYIFRIKEFVPLLLSDSLGLYIWVFICSISSLLLALISYYLIPPNFKKKEIYLLRVFVSYYLSLILLIYGANKLFKFQFYQPEPNTLFTPLGYLSKDILYWSITGSSYSFNIIIGLIQIITAVFLLFRNTRIIGGTLAVVLFANIVLVNFTYDISVKVFSSFLFSLSIFISFPLLKVVYILFYKQKPYTEQLKNVILFKQSKRNILSYVVLKTSVIGFFLFVTFYPYFKIGAFNGDLMPKNILYGAYKTSPNEISVRKFFFHSKGYLIFQDEEDHLKDYKIIALNSSIIKLRDYNNQVYSLEYKLMGDTLSLKGEINSVLFSIKGKRIDLSKLPLLQEDFHWSVE